TQPLPQGADADPGHGGGLTTTARKRHPQGEHDNQRKCTDPWQFDPYRESHRDDDQQPQIDQKLFHHPALNASTMFKRIARSAGANPTNRPKASISAMPVSQV